MLLQAIVLIATMTVLASALLTSSLTSAHAAFRERLLAKTQTAMSDATARFATWAQDHVLLYGTEQNWPTTPQPMNANNTVGISTPICDGQLSTTRQTQSTCAMTATMRWNVTGWSAGINSRLGGRANVSSAKNLSTTLHEQRISATITVFLTNPTNNITYSTHSREVTARIFDAYPYIVITAMRDASSEDLTVSAKEGDTAGTLFRENGNLTRLTPPDQNSPANAVDTTINTTITCDNSNANDDQTFPNRDSNLGTYLRMRNVGNQAWVYEAPCAPTYENNINLSGAPTDYQPTKDNVYSNNTTTPTSSWTKNSTSASFSR